MSGAALAQGPRVGAPPTSPGEVPVSVLLVDDGLAKRLSLKAILVPLGYPVVEADSGIAALRCLLDADFAVILLDVHMPGMDGFETAALIRQRTQSEMTPIIFMTAFGTDEIVQTDRYVQGAVDFIFAPVAPDELRAKVSVFASLFMRARALAAQAREVQTSADRLRLLTDAAPIGIFHTDSQNRYIYTNPPWTEITGISGGDAAGQRWDTIVGSEQRAELVAEDALDQTEFSRRFELAHPGERSRVVLVTSKATHDRDGAIDGWVGTLADVTAEAGAEAAMSNARDEATEASHLKSDFLANMSHEIRTPMNGVIGMTDLLLETKLDARQRDYAQTVRNSGEALLTIINDILDFSKVEAGKLELEDVRFSPRTIVEGVVDLLAPTAQAKGYEVVLAIEHGVPAGISGDPGRLRQVLTNLIGNAIKFTSSGEIVVRVQMPAQAQTAPVLRFEVSDTGDGIAPKSLATVFDPFVQADTSTSRKYGGTGLGLAISSHLVSLMGGTFGASSELGTGSTFWFTIGLRPRSPDEPAARDSRLTGVSVLIVDDSPAQLGVLSDHLNDWGMLVEAAGSGSDALTAIQAAAAHGRPFAVVVIDRFMPDMDGLELIDLIRSDPARAEPLVLVTRLGLEADLDAPIRSSISAILSKPVRPSDLRASILVALGEQAAERGHTYMVSVGSATPELGNVLLAEDNLINQKVAVAMLAGSGYRVDTVLDGLAAVEAVSRQRYDAILMDCQMPQMNGYEATAAIRARERGGRRTPIVAMTAGARPEDRARCIAADMDDYIAKPVSKDALLAVLADSVAASRAMSNAA
jgi:two-component system, sensor histidine kinase and response regulator